MIEYLLNIHNDKKVINVNLEFFQNIIVVVDNLLYNCCCKYSNLFDRLSKAILKDIFLEIITVLIDLQFNTLIIVIHYVLIYLKYIFTYRKQLNVNITNDIK